MARRPPGTPSITARLPRSVFQAVRIRGVSVIGRSAYREEDVGPPFRRVGLGAGVRDVDLPGRTGRFEPLRTHPLGQCRPGLRKALVGPHVRDRGDGSGGQLACLNATRALQGRRHGHSAFEVHRVAVHAVIAGEGHTGRILAAFLDVSVNLAEQRPHEITEFVRGAGGSDSQDGLGFNLPCLETQRHRASLPVSCQLGAIPSRPLAGVGRRSDVRV